MIDKRHHRRLPDPYRGTLSDYVAFYFTPLSPMMLNIKTGLGGVTKRANDEIVILVSSISKLTEHGIKYVISDRHAYLQTAEFFHEPESLGRIDWSILRRRDFKRDPDDPEKVDRYQAECLALAHVPFRALSGVVCCNAEIKADVMRLVGATGLASRVIDRPGWFF